MLEQQPGVAVRKDILRRRGLLAGNTVRHPGAGLPPGASEQLDALIEALLPDTLVGVATDLTLPDEHVRVASVAVWRQESPGVWRIVLDMGNDACDCPKP